jgi:hypothetical protein
MNSAEYRAMRRLMLQGQVPAGCRKCVKEEEAGMVSKRLHSQYLLPSRRFGRAETEWVDGDQVRTLEVSLGNACNLRCVMCNPERSSAWNREAAILGYQTVPFSVPDLQRLDGPLLSARNIHLLGGETFLVPELKTVLEMIIEKGRPAESKVTVNTNVTVFPLPHLRELFRHFLEVEINLSIDGLGARNEYIRFPSRWPVVAANTSCFLEWRASAENIKVGLDATVSAYSLGGLPDLLHWWCDQGGDIVYLNPVVSPEPLRVQALAPRIREEVCARFPKLPELAASAATAVQPLILQAGQPELHAELMRWTSLFDQARGVSSSLVMPEIFTGWD